VITVAVRWYLRYSLSYRDMEELLAERGIDVDHVTIYRWVQRFTPLFADAARPLRHPRRFGYRDGSLRTRAARERIACWASARKSGIFRLTSTPRIDGRPRESGDLPGCDGRLGGLCAGQSTAAITV
jgi:hypothetical protein